MTDTTNNRIQLKDKSGNLLFPEILGVNIPDKGVTKAKISDELKNEISSKVDNDTFELVRTIVEKLDGTDAIDGSVKKQIKDAISALVGTAPDTLNTLQKIAEEMQDPSNNTAQTVLDQVAGKAEKASTLQGYGIGDAYTKEEIDTKLSSYITYTVVQ